MSESKPKSPPTMNEVAKAADVSVATVSRVVNGQGGVSAKLEKRVRQAMKELHYHPSLLASSLKKQRSMLVGILIPILEHPSYSRMASVIEKKLFDYGYRGLICNSEEDEERETAYIEMLLRQRVEGIIINSSARNTQGLLELQKNNIPIVLFDRSIENLHCDQVFSDNSQGGYIAIQHLVELGHRRIGIIAAPTYPEPIKRRLRGVQEALTNYGIPHDPELLIMADTQLFDMGYEAARHLLQLDPPPTAIFALTDVTAIGVMHAAAEMNFRIPEDLSVIGFDDIPMASYTIPQLTTVAQPFVEMGNTAVDLLLNHIVEPDQPPQKAVLETALVIRETTARPSTG
ncbi:MAG: LacI family DNA-binding transcriptional regulator [Anaerolineae bacterium]